MNKNFFLICTILLVTTSLIGQEKEKKHTNNFNIGINVGPNYNSFRGDSWADKYDSQFNYFFGLSFEYHMNEDFSILTNLNYENRSYKAEYNGSNLVWWETYKVEDETNIKNLNIPILLKYKFGFEKEFYINGGFFYNHIFDVSNEMINTETGEDLSFIDFNYIYKDKEYGISLGIGMTFKLNEKNNLTFEIRDDFGITDIGDTEVANISNSYTNTIKLIANWSLNL
jgi:hypothetical protein